MNQTCSKCKHNEFNYNSQRSIEYDKWEKIEVSREGAKGAIYNVKIMQLLTLSCTVTQLVNNFNVQFEKYNMYSQ